MLEGHLFETSGLQFDTWLFGPEKFRNFRETGPRQLTWAKRDPRMDKQASCCEMDYRGHFYAD